MNSYPQPVTTRVKRNRQLYERLTNLSFYLIFVNIIIESYINFFDNRSVIVSLQLGLNTFFFLYFFSRRIRIGVPRIFYPVLFISIYLIFFSVFSSDPFTTFNYLSKFLIPFPYLIIGYSLMISYDYFDRFVSKLWMILFYFVISVVLSNVLGYGNTLYPGSILVGYNGLNSLYVPVFSIILILFRNNHVKSLKHRYLNIICSILCTILIIVILKRTLIILLLLGLLGYILFNFSLKKLLRLFFVVALSGILLISYFSDFVNQSITARQSRFNAEYDITAEGRFVENEIIYNYMKDNPDQLLFGSYEVFNDRRIISSLRLYEGEREAHNSYIRIFWSGGIIATFAYLLFCWKQFRVLLKIIRSRIYKNLLIRSIIQFTLVLIILRFINDFSSGITYISYNAFCMLIIGSCIGIAINFQKEGKYATANSPQNNQSTDLNNLYQC